ncbi:interleukin-6 receptor subunit alpha [Ctenodactylus gundi]
MPERSPTAAGEPGEVYCFLLPSEVAKDVLTSLQGASVTLICPAEDLGDNATVHWMLSSPHHTRWAGQGERLLLRSVQLKHSGNYSCYVDRHLAGTVRLLVEAPPEKPRLSCFRRNPVSNVICEWSPQKLPSPTTQAVLRVTKLGHNPLTEESQKPCPYSQESQKFICQLRIPEPDRDIHVVSLCVANSAGSKISDKQAFLGSGILQPDPPANVLVSPVAGYPRWLNVSWEDPKTWSSIFYRLRFELRYRPEESTLFTTWRFTENQHQCIIPDAWSNVRHVVQVRAQEEFETGFWSEWSPEATGTPWIVKEFGSGALPTFLVAGGSLAFGSLLCVGVILRLKKTWKSEALAESKPSAHPPCSLGQPKPTVVFVPLLSRPVSPSSLESNKTTSQSQPDAKDPRSPYDVSNRDYFFPR